MPRQPRYYLPGIPQHVIQRGVNRQAVFFEPADYNLYLEALNEAAFRYDCQVHAYVLMTNHTHLLMTPGNKRSIPLAMQALGRRYVQTINKKYERTGTLWEGRYKASLVQEDRYLLTCYRYIELNPVRAGLVSAPGSYVYSSFACNAMGRSSCLITPHQSYLELAPTPKARQAAYRRLFGDVIRSDMLTTIRDTTNACLVLGGEQFRDRIEVLLGRSVRHGKSGRPASVDCLVPNARKPRSDPD